MRIDNSATNAQMQADMKLKAKQTTMQAHIENALADRSVNRMSQPMQANSDAIRESQGAEPDEG
ncbi:hypothetical protein [Chelativorans salis]|uniref:Uncharacterized protein n=1 Tax=Chelativorans salis TaxID=2978478 RepID=A0ABT2LQX3_9HYPH|nr:hypothetical protein [Chelativorans sp. EGI FJ00035]MCT7376839.1 hypothetical protein [Chelativorans sp. EGI FJ00035]